MMTYYYSFSQQISKKVPKVESVLEMVSNYLEECFLQWKKIFSEITGFLFSVREAELINPHTLRKRL